MTSGPIIGTSVIKPTTQANAPEITANTNAVPAMTNSSTWYCLPNQTNATIANTIGNMMRHLFKLGFSNRLSGVNICTIFFICFLKLSQFLISVNLCYFSNRDDFFSFRQALRIIWHLVKVQVFIDFCGVSQSITHRLQIFGMRRHTA